MAAAAAAFEATAAAAGRDVDAAALAAAARSHARALWRAGPAHPYCLRVGISSSEGLWCRFEGERRLREWAPAYRRETWRLALAEQGVDDAELAEELGERFGRERRARHEVFDDVVPALDDLERDWTLALVTNGASCLQREKLVASRLADRFGAVVVSGDLGVGKPDAAVFAHALSQLGCGGRRAVMIGDSLTRDIHGAIAAGLGAIWVNRSGAAHPEGRPDLAQVSTLRDLPAALDAFT